MKKHRNVFLMAMLAGATGYAQQSTNLTGGGNFDLSGMAFAGASGGSLVTNAASARVNGEVGITVSPTTPAFTLKAVGGGAQSTGGNGGTVENTFATGAKAQAHGGDGLRWIAGVGNGNPGGIVLSDVTYAGGAGGSATYGSDEVKTYPMAYFGDVSGANGGHGVFVSGQDFFPYGTTIMISNGTFSGGAGGMADNSDIGDAYADGGSGVAVDFVTQLEILDGTFSGGAGGTANGAAGADGYGVRTRDTNLRILGGTFSGNGLSFMSQYYDCVANVFGGAFGTALFLTRGDDYDLSHVVQGGANIYGGTFDEMRLVSEYGVGAGSQLGTGSANIYGGTIGALSFDGDGNHALVLANAATVASVTKDGAGSLTVSQWADDHFRAFSANAGKTTFAGSGHQFIHKNGATVRIGAPAEVAFNDGLTAEAGSVFVSEYDGTSLGKMTGSDMDFAAGVLWDIDGDTNDVAFGTTFDLATASGTLTSLIANSDVRYLGSGGSWLGGISDVSVVGGGTLVATYDAVEIDDAFTAMGVDPDSEAGQAAEDLADAVPVGSDPYNELAGMDEGVAISSLANEYVYTVEMGSSLIRLNEIFADQIKGRLRSARQYQGWGTSSASPDGVAGPETWYDNTRIWMDEHLPAWDARGTARKVDEVLPHPENRVLRPGSHGPSEALPSTTADRVMEEDLQDPATAWQLWGQGYGSHFSQDSADGHPGYDADFAGAMVGVDRRWPHMLLGLAAGYASTSIDGDGGNDGDADTGNGTLYFSVNSDHLFLDANLTYAYHDVETEGPSALGYEGDYNAGTYAGYLGAGAGIPLFSESLVLTPEASILATYYDADGYTEKSDMGLPDKKWDSYNDWSYLSSLGASLAYTRRISGYRIDMEFRPEIHAYWMHEFNDEMDDSTYRMIGGMHDIDVAFQPRDSDLVKFGGGVLFARWGSRSTEFGVNLDGVWGSDYTSYVLSGKLMHRF